MELFFFKAAQIFENFLGYLEKRATFKTKTAVSNFWATLGEMGFFLFQQLITLDLRNNPIEQKLPRQVYLLKPIPTITQRH